MKDFQKPFYILAAVFIAYAAFTVKPLVRFFSTENYVTIDGKKYTEADLADNPIYKKVRKGYVEGLSQAFQAFAAEEIVKNEAKSKGMDEKEFLRSSVSKPTEAEILQVFEQAAPRLGGKKLEEVRSQIVDYLASMKEDQFRRGLSEKYKIAIHVEKPGRQKVEEKNNPTLGPKDAKVTIVEFSDFECPYCNKSQEVNRALRDKYKDKIRWVFRDYPLPFHKNAMGAHMAANCAMQDGKYWEVFNGLFDNFRQLSDATVREIAYKAGVNKEKFNSCMADADGKTAGEIQQDIQDGQALGVNGTPAFFINGIMVEGARELAEFERIIDSELSTTN